jgi:hypothetical protein
VTAIRMRTLLILLPLLVVGCSYGSLDDYPGLEQRIAAYYELEKQQRWNDSYAYRVPAFRQSVPLKLYTETMTRDSKGWILQDAKVRRIEKRGNVVRVHMVFLETPPAGRYPVPVGDLSTEDYAEWELIEGTWQAWSTADRSYLSMNAAVVPPNPPVNADACGRAAMHPGCRARAGYRAR